ncbi:MAG: hypothetical protein IAI50_00065 [Candidatus Eremiobacteraeota bacterium]|nr:hypothetical protein [Candidatus Eremiobacteraeota bacterium]
MHSGPLTLRALCAMLPAALLASCASGGFANSPGSNQSAASSVAHRPMTVDAAFTRVAVNRKPNWISPEAQMEAKTAGLLFVADAVNNDIVIFSKHDPKTPLGTITDGIDYPEEIAVDSSANLYVANLSNANVTVYKPPYTASPSMTYSSGLTYPFSVTVGNDGTVYVSDNPNGTVGQVLEYPANKNSPSLALPITGYVEGVALDREDRLYAGVNSQSGDVLRFEPHSKKSVDLKLPIAYVSGVVLDDSDNLLAEDQIPSTVDVFAPGKKTPSQTFDNGGNGFGDPVSIAIGTYEKHLYIGDGQNDVVDIVAYPSGKTIGSIGGFGRVHGVAVSPPAPK